MSVWAFRFLIVAARAIELAIIEGGSELNLRTFRVYNTGLVFFLVNNFIIASSSRLAIRFVIQYRQKGAQKMKIVIWQ